PEELSKSIYSKKSYLKKLEAKSENFKNALYTNNGEPFNILEQHISTHIRARLDVSTLDINDENPEKLKPYNFIISIANDIKTDDNLDEHINSINSTISEKKDKNAKIIIFSKGTTSSIYFEDIVKKINTEVYNVQEYRFIDPEIIFYDIQTIYLDDFHEKEKEQDKKEKQTSNSAITNQTNSYSRSDEIFENGAVLCGEFAIVATTCYGIYKGGKCLYNKYIKPKTETAKNIIHKS
ncbi:MAG: hypothetical protein Q4B84_01010, partial [Clostridia bacterium]|nr:hypothetical protein [Clostridia bacterium]